MFAIITITGNNGTRSPLSIIWAYEPSSGDSQHGQTFIKAITKATWEINIWNNDEINFSNTSNLIQLLDRLKETNEVKPIQSNTQLNVITTLGLRQMSLRNLPGTHTRTQNTHHAVGIGTRLENLSDEALQSVK